MAGIERVSGFQNARSSSSLISTTTPSNPNKEYNSVEGVVIESNSINIDGKRFIGSSYEEIRNDIISKSRSSGFSDGLTNSQRDRALAKLRVSFGKGTSQDRAYTQRIQREISDRSRLGYSTIKTTKTFNPQQIVEPSVVRTRTKTMGGKSVVIKELKQPTYNTVIQEFARQDKKAVYTPVSKKGEIVVAIDKDSVAGSVASLKMIGSTPKEFLQSIRSNSVNVDSPSNISSFEKAVYSQKERDIGSSKRFSLYESFVKTQFTDSSFVRKYDPVERFIIQPLSKVSPSKAVFIRDVRTKLTAKLVFGGVMLGEIVSSAGEKGYLFNRAIFEKDIGVKKVVSTAYGKEQFKATGKAIKEQFNPKTPEGVVNIGLAVGSVLIGGSLAKSQLKTGKTFSSSRLNNKPVKSRQLTLDKSIKRFSRQQKISNIKANVKGFTKGKIANSKYNLFRAKIKAKQIVKKTDLTKPKRQLSQNKLIKRTDRLTNKIAEKNLRKYYVKQAKDQLKEGDFNAFLDKYGIEVFKKGQKINLKKGLDNTGNLKYIGERFRANPKVTRARSIKRSVRQSKIKLRKVESKIRRDQFRYEADVISPGKKIQFQSKELVKEMARYKDIGEQLKFIKTRTLKKGGQLTLRDLEKARILSEEARSLSITIAERKNIIFQNINSKTGVKEFIKRGGSGLLRNKKGSYGGGQKLELIQVEKNTFSKTFKSNIDKGYTYKPSTGNKLTNFQNINRGLLFTPKNSFSSSFVLGNLALFNKTSSIPKLGLKGFQSFKPVSIQTPRIRGKVIQRSSQVSLTGQSFNSGQVFNVGQALSLGVIPVLSGISAYKTVRPIEEGFRKIKWGSDSGGGGGSFYSGLSLGRGLKVFNVNTKKVLGG